MKRDLEAILASYLETAIWSSTGLGESLSNHAKSFGSTDVMECQKDGTEEWFLE